MLDPEEPSALRSSVARRASMSFVTVTEAQDLLDEQQKEAESAAVEIAEHIKMLFGMLKSEEVVTEMFLDDELSYQRLSDSINKISEPSVEPLQNNNESGMRMENATFY